MHSTHSCKYDLSIVVPAYNEEKRIGLTLRDIAAYVRRKKIDAELIVVDDGSTDRTIEVVSLTESLFRSLKVVQLKTNSGKGHAIKKGVEVSSGRLILFTDADNSTPMYEFEKLLSALEKENVAIAIGSRYLPDSYIDVKQSFSRILLGRIGNLLIRHLLLPDIRDTQCGFKLFRHEVAKELFALQTVSRFAFDMEVLARARGKGYTIIEVPISWLNSPESRLRPVRDALITLKDLFFIKWRLRKK